MGVCFRVCVCFGLVISRIRLLFLYFIVSSAFLIKIVMNTYHAASWSDPYSSSDEEEEICRYMGCPRIYSMALGWGLSGLFVAIANVIKWWSDSPGL